MDNHIILWRINPFDESNYISRHHLICEVIILFVLFLCSLGGLILDHAVGNFAALAAFQPVMNGE